MIECSEIRPRGGGEVGKGRQERGERSAREGEGERGWREALDSLAEVSGLV